MSLDRGILAKVDRRVLAELDHTEGTQLVKVPVSDAVWSTWKRYCDVAGVTMGRGMAMLLYHELASVVDVDLEELGARLERREAKVGARESELAEREQDVSRREAEVAAKGRRLAAEGKKRIQSGWTPPKRGRNEPCWCGSDKKFKYCHGAPGKK
jgi:preprotein translocase subunit SecA